MPNLRSIALAVGGIAIFALAAVFTLSLTLVAGAVLSLTLLTRMVTMRKARAPVYARASRQPQADMRIWNDGRGTIIDM